MSHAEAQPSWSGGGRFWLAVAVAVVSVVAYAAWIAFRVGGAHTTLVVDDAGNLVAPALAAVAILRRETGTALAESLVPQLEGATDAAGMLLRLTGRVPPRLADDVTVVVLHRRPARPSPVHAFEPAAQLESSGRTKVP
jgi:hypothetical protein